METEKSEMRKSGKAETETEKSGKSETRKIGNYG
jgi:hypothetical protein